jgi:hypothetical protein
MHLTLERPLIPVEHKAGVFPVAAAPALSGLKARLAPGGLRPLRKEQLAHGVRRRKHHRFGNISHLQV